MNNNVAFQNQAKLWQEADVSDRLLTSYMKSVMSGLAINFYVLYFCGC